MAATLFSRRVLDVTLVPFRFDRTAVQITLVKRNQHRISAAE